MDTIDILAGLIIPPTPEVVQALEEGLLVLSSDRLSPAQATALLQRLCAKAPSVEPYTQAGENIMRRLLDLGADPWAPMPETPTCDAPTAAHAALSQCWPGAVIMALPLLPRKQVATLTTPHRGHRISWLRFCVDNGLDAAVKALLDLGADPNAPQPDGSPLLHHAPAYGRTFSLLLDGGANPVARDQEGRLCVENWPDDNTEEYVAKLATVLDMGPGLDRMSLINIAGVRPRAAKPLLGGVRDPKELVDHQGRSIFFHMAANTLDNRGAAIYRRPHEGWPEFRTTKQILAIVKDALSWHGKGPLDNPLDEGAARLLLWSARQLSKQGLDAASEKIIQEWEVSLGLSSTPTPGCVGVALKALDILAAEGLIHDPSEVAATALAGYWTAVGQTPDAMEALFDQHNDYPGFQWLDRCFRGAASGPWSQGQWRRHRWNTPDVPIETFSSAFMEFARKAPDHHPMWSQPAMASTLIHMVRGDWPATGGEKYYEMALNPLDDGWSELLHQRHAAVFDRLDRHAIKQALNDPCCRRTIEAMKGKNCHLQSLAAFMEYEDLNEATAPAPRPARSGPRL